MGWWRGNESYVIAGKARYLLPACVLGLIAITLFGIQTGTATQSPIDPASKRLNTAILVLVYLLLRWFVAWRWQGIAVEVLLVAVAVSLQFSFVFSGLALSSLW